MMLPVDLTLVSSSAQLPSLRIEGMRTKHAKSIRLFMKFRKSVGVYVGYLTVGVIQQIKAYDVITKGFLR